MDLVGCRARSTFREYQTCGGRHLLRFLLGVAAVVMRAVALLALLLAGLKVRILLHGEDHGSKASGGGRGAAKMCVCVILAATLL